MPFRLEPDRRRRCVRSRHDLGSKTIFRRRRPVAGSGTHLNAGTLHLKLDTMKHSVLEVLGVIRHEVVRVGGVGHPTERRAKIVLPGNDVPSRARRQVSRDRPRFISGIVWRRARCPRIDRIQ
jgi:hypothetical protein